MKVTNRSCCVTRHISSFEIPTTSKRVGLVSGVFSWKHGMELKGTIRKLQHNSKEVWSFKCNFKKDFASVYQLQQSDELFQSS